mgnify:CR=1 FL=1
MNKLTQEQIEFLLDQYDVTEETISTIEKIFEDLNIEDFQYFILVAEVVSEYQSFKLNFRNAAFINKRIRSVQCITYF